MYVSSCNVKQTISILNYPSSKFTVGNSDFVGNFHRNLACLFIIVIQKFAPAYHKEQGKHKPRDRSARCVFFFFKVFQQGSKFGSKWRIWSFWWSTSGGKTPAVVAICGFQGLSWIMTSMFLNRKTWEASCETPGHTWDSSKSVKISLL